MTTTHYVTEAGAYIGGFGDGAVPPEGAIEVKCPPNHASQLFVDGNWQAYTPSKEEQSAKRQVSYASEADPLFFKWQAGEATEEEWLSKRKEIRERYPVLVKKDYQDVAKE